MANLTAGSGEPYWYEWTVGLLKIVEMLHPDSDIESVTLQAHGSKGWDDVVVRRSKGRTDWYQVKHTRLQTRFTFSSLVAAEQDQPSLLRSLFDSWRELKLRADRDQCVLFTNRDAGQRVAISDAGVARPALLEFMPWLRRVLSTTNSLGAIRPPGPWVDAWAEWLAQLDEGTPEEGLGFLRSFDVQPSQEDLPQLTSQVLADLATTFGVAENKARPLLHALDHALRGWTVAGEAVTAETVMDALALDDSTEGEQRAPPPPSPFFPSRKPFLKNLEALLREREGPRVIFLSAEPGAGKTSALSELANRRSNNALEGIVGIRYFAFRPLSPESPVIPGDADQFVRPEALWFDLLRQLRRGLRGRLRLYSVPVRDELLDWPEARNHVLRLASRIGEELGRPFVIVIDGIDHAARAELTDPVRSREFFASLPAPEEVAKLSIRLLLAGQPATDYPQYPEWLRVSTPSVHSLGFGPLQTGDVTLLLETSSPTFPAEQYGAAARVILELTGGNTLGVVFACAEAGSCDNAESLRSRLLTRQLQSGITAYYRNIWEHCVAGVSQSVATVLAGAIALARERITGTLLESCFPGMGQSAQAWNLLLGRLGPLIVEEGAGYRIRHNDFRVFLQGYLNAFPAVQRREVASGFANHYQKPDANRYLAHESLLSYLRQSNREREWPTIFDVSWVMEAAGLGLDYSEIAQQCVAALTTASTLEDWEVIGNVACACETLERWRERCEFDRPSILIKRPSISPAFLRTELFVRPLTEWESSDLLRLAQDGVELLRSGENARAGSLLSRWLTSLDISTICDRLRDKRDTGPSLSGNRTQLSPEATDAFEELGRISRLVGFVIPLGNISEGMSAQAASAFEKGWFDESCKAGPFTSPRECFLKQTPRFYSTIADTLSTLASAQRWPLVKQLLIAETEHREALAKFRPVFAFKAAWWSLRSGADQESKDWVSHVNTKPSKFEGEQQLVPALACARIRGWSEPSIEIATIGDDLLQALTLPEAREEHSGYYGLWLRTAATVGRLQGILARSGSTAASEIIRPREVRQLASALWNYNNRPAAIHSDWSTSGALAAELVDAAVQLNEDHKEALLASADEALADWPIDDRRPGIWRLLQKTGRTDKLRQWLTEWLGNDGRVFRDTPADREHLVDAWEPFAFEIGATDLIDEARKKLASGRITYRSDRDGTFFTASTLLDEYLRQNPNEWAETGVQVWSLSDAASGYGCGNSYESSIAKALAKAALRSGPSHIVRLVLAEAPNRSDLYWLHEVRNYLIEGIRGILQEGDHVLSDVKLSWWCLTIGFCRWFQDGDVHRLRDLRESLLETCSSTDRIDLLREIHRISPAEAVRSPVPESPTESKHSRPEKEEQPQSYDELIRRVQNGGHCLLPQILDLVREALNRDVKPSDPLIATILRSAGYKEDFTYHWRVERAPTVDAVYELARLLSDSQLWPLMENAIGGWEKGWSWLQAVTDNIQLLCAARSTARGGAILKTALLRQMAMHRRWICGLKDYFTYEPVKLPPEISIADWHTAAAHVLCYILNSRTGEVLASAIHGIHCLAVHRPETIKTFFHLTANDEWRSQWILNCAEAWASLEPAAVSNGDEFVTAWLNNGPLAHRLQAWVIKAWFNLRSGEDLPALPWPKNAPTESTIITKQRDALELPPVSFGLMHVSDGHRAATQHLACLEAAIGEMGGVRHRTAELLDELPERDRSRPWPEAMRQHGDINVGLADVGLLIGRAIEESMPAPRGEIIKRLAQGFLSNEDPWVLRHSPLPDEDLSAWPNDDQVGGWRTPPDTSALRERLLLLSCEHARHDDEIVLAAHVEVYSSFYDVHFNVWWEQRTNDESEVSAAHLPTTINARSFNWWLGNWWQPSPREGIRPLVFVPGGFQRLAHSFTEWFPARLWNRELGWTPSVTDPLVWTLKGEPIARFERLHGRTRDRNNYHHRQPILARWLLKRSVFEDISEKLNSLHRVDDLAHAPSPER
jgi:hypothetical protein